MRNVFPAVAVIGMMMTFVTPIHGDGAEPKFTRVAPQYIAALGEPGAKSGNNAQTWGLWRVDPGPRGVPLISYDRLMQVGGVAPANWKFDSQDWWLEEHGLIMEKPTFPLSPGRYQVTGDREATAVLTIHRPDKDGNQRWELSDAVTLYDVTHLACRAARYTPGTGPNACSPAKAPRSAFRVAPGRPMPPVDDCNKQDYTVLIVLAVAPDDANATK